MMTPVLEIGLPDLSDESIEELAEACERAITEYILDKLSDKSIEDLSVSCTLQLIDQLDVELDIMVSQKYGTVEDLDQLIDDAITHGVNWLENRILEMKDN